MKHGKKYGTVALVLANGMLCAWLARSPEVAPVSSNTPLSTTSELQDGPSPGPLTVGPQPAKPEPIRLNISAEEPAESSRQQESDFAVPLIDRPPTIVADAAVPHLPNEFQPHFEPLAYPTPQDKDPVPTIEPADEGSADGEGDVEENASPQAVTQLADAAIHDENAQADESATANVPPLPLRHRIRDGDTLESIAARYYGDPTLRLQIFRANPNTLVNPDLLPIDAEITVPAMDQFDAPAGDDDQTQTDLTPIPATAPPAAVLPIVQ